MKTITAVLIAAIIAVPLSGCTTSDPSSSLESKAARMSPELLRSQVLRYKALVEKAYTEKQNIAALSDIFSTLAPKDAPYTPKTAKATSDAFEQNPELREWKLRHQENLKYYHFFYKKLQERGGDMAGLKLDPSYDHEQLWYEYRQFLPPKQEEQKPLFPPIEETPSPYFESQATEPV